MPLVPLDQLPDDARTWVFAASDPLPADDAQHLLGAVDAYLATWTAHGAPLTVGRELREDRFLAIAVDQRTAGASGCSIDGLYRALRTEEETLGVTLIAGGRVFWRDAAGAVQGGTRAEFAAAGSGADTVVFDTLVSALGDWRTRFERRAAETWHAALLPTAQPSTVEQ
jgi:hypothetical protein